MENKMNYYKYFTLLVFMVLVVYSLYLATHFKALVFTAMGEYDYSYIVRGLAKYGSSAIMLLWFFQLIYYLRIENVDRTVRIITLINLFLLPIFVFMNMKPYLG